uniref:Uncharacterized protein n=1 Tax=Timema monikensis TaxID=170555 RepID=A0A7R9EJW4_9NEOP|nr:unnamed protein product [Timema monikensis]
MEGGLLFTELLAYSGRRLTHAYTFPGSQEYWVAFLLRIAYSSYSLHPVDERARCDRWTFGLLRKLVHRISNKWYPLGALATSELKRSYDLLTRRTYGVGMGPPMNFLQGAVHMQCHH